MVSEADCNKTPSLKIMRIDRRLSTTQSVEFAIVFGLLAHACSRQRKRGWRDHGRRHGLGGGVFGCARSRTLGGGSSYGQVGEPARFGGLCCKNLGEVTNCVRTLNQDNVANMNLCMNKRLTLGDSSTGAGDGG
jgi:hypothetical protein